MIRANGIVRGYAAKGTSDVAQRLSFESKFPVIASCIVIGNRPNSALATKRELCRFVIRFRVLFCVLITRYSEVTRVFAPQWTAHHESNRIPNVDTSPRSRPSVLSEDVRRPRERTGAVLRGERLRQGQAR
jgi:hypothetical protein